jgi:hypothetical protein
MKSIKAIMAEARRSGRDPLEILKSDPDWMREQAERDAGNKQFHALLIEDASPLARALAMINYRVETAWDLVNAQYSYRSALPVLVEHLQRPYHPRNLEGIVRALTVPPARDLAWDALLAIARRPVSSAAEESLQDAAFNALAVIATEADLPILAQMALDRTLGSGRSAFLIRLRRSKYPEIESILARSTEDPDLAPQARIESRKLARKRPPADR